MLAVHVGRGAARGDPKQRLGFPFPSRGLATSIPTRSSFKSASTRKRPPNSPFTRRGTYSTASRRC